MPTPAFCFLAAKLHFSALALRRRHAFAFQAVAFIFISVLFVSLSILFRRFRRHAPLSLRAVPLRRFV